MDTQSFLLGVIATALVGGGGYYLGSQQHSSVPNQVANASQVAVQNPVPPTQNSIPQTDPLVAAVSEYTAQPNPATSSSAANPGAGQNNFEHFRVRQQKRKKHARRWPDCMDWHFRRRDSL